MKNAIKTGLFAIVMAVSAAACNEDETTATTPAEDSEVIAPVDTANAVSAEKPAEEVKP